ncbi:PilW family protein [Denitrificimonas caeni]|uniref:PilW family protein n=1 Tax=Denitrificimonas caeni TaxID=521720 RepID=UPI0019668788|nr:hypothetical protein [Denitrificimonas caeni]
MRRINNQRGFTLISLLVGTVLSLLTIVAMLALYKNLVQVAVIATQDANHDGGLASALLTAQLELQSAGFGLDGSANIYLPSTATILWRYKDLDTLKTSCSGLLLRPHPIKTELNYRTLTLLHKPDCNAALSTLSVAESDTALKASWGTGSDAITNLAVLAPLTVLTFEKTDTTACSNYSVGNTFKQPKITIEATNSSSADALKTTYTVCLSNIRSTP